jgi:hypothetical protein
MLRVSILIGNILSVSMQSISIPCVIKLSVIMLSASTLSVIILSVSMLIVVMLNVVAPKRCLTTAGFALQVSTSSNVFSSSLTLRRNKLERLSLQTF